MDPILDPRVVALREAIASSVFADCSDDEGQLDDPAELEGPENFEDDEEEEDEDS